MTIRRSRCTALAVAVLSATAFMSAAHAAAPRDAAGYPDRPIRLLVPYPPGGGVDSVGRVLAQAVATRLGQQIVIDNRGGAGGIVGIDIAARSLPDGYTLLMGSVGLTSMPGLYKKLPFDPVRDFAPITIAVSGTYVLAVNTSVPVTNVKELIALAKKSPGRLNWGSAGAGSTIHLAGEMLRSMAQIDITHIPYKGAASALTDLIGGQIQILFAPVLAMMPMVKAGKVRAIGATSPQRSEIAPDIPTIAESGIPGFEVSGWYGFLAPRAVPRNVVTKLYAETKNSLDSETLKERLRGMGLDIIAANPESSAKFVQDDIARWSKVIRDAGIQPE